MEILNNYICVIKNNISLVGVNICQPIKTNHWVQNEWSLSEADFWSAGAGHCYIFAAFWPKLTSKNSI